MKKTIVLMLIVVLGTTLTVKAQTEGGNSSSLLNGLSINFGLGTNSYKVASNKKSWEKENKLNAFVGAETEFGLSAGLIGMFRLPKEGEILTNVEGVQSAGIFQVGMSKYFPEGSNVQFGVSPSLCFGGGKVLHEGKKYSSVIYGASLQTSLLFGKIVKVFVSYDYLFNELNREFGWTTGIALKLGN